MNKSVPVLFSMLIFFTSIVYGEGYSEKRDNVLIPPGMETIKEGDVNVVVPKGGRLRKQGSVMLIETADEYSARKFEDSDNRFKKMEKNIEAQKKYLRDLKDEVKKREEDGREK